MDQLTYSDVITLFDFLDSETPASIEWIHTYLRKNNFAVNSQCWGTNNIKNWLASTILSNQIPPESVKTLARKMRNAWKVRSHRKKPTSTVPLSVNIARPVYAQLSDMSKGRQKSTIISELIQGNYQEFANKKFELKLEKIKVKNRKIPQGSIERLWPTKKQDQNLSCDSLKPCNELEQQKKVNEELKEGIAALFDLMFSVNERRETVNDQILIEATRIYYSCFKL